MTGKWSHLCGWVEGHWVCIECISYKILHSKCDLVIIIFKGWIMILVIWESADFFYILGCFSKANFLFLFMETDWPVRLDFGYHCQDLVM